MKMVLRTDQRCNQQGYRGAECRRLGQRQVHEDHTALDYVQAYVAVQ